MEMKIRPYYEEEKNFFYSAGTDIVMRTGCIGMLRGDMDTNGMGFYCTWFDMYRTLKTPEFQAEFDNVVNALRSDKAFGPFLKNRDAMKKYCEKHPDSAIGREDWRNYAFRVDTEQYSYMIRLNPVRGDYNFYIYCYLKQYLDRYTEAARNGIRFITPSYEEKFHIRNGDSIVVHYADGKHEVKHCCYIDEYHVEISNCVYHICEYAELLERCGAKVVPHRASLPRKCYFYDRDTGKLMEVEHGKGMAESHLNTPDKGVNRDRADKYNRNIGVTKPQMLALVHGARYGWDAPEADPSNYDEDGNFLAASPNTREG